ncbi:MAG: RNA chaperone Hfq [Nitrospirota bacterium]
MNSNPFDEALENFHSKDTEAALVLKDGSQLRGRIKRFDGYVVFLENGAETMVYRHSILKLSDAAQERAEIQPAPRPEPRKTPAPTSSRKPPVRQKRPPRREPPQAVQQKEPAGSLSRMGEELQKWLKNQKGNE